MEKGNLSARFPLCFDGDDAPDGGSSRFFPSGAFGAGFCVRSVPAPFGHHEFRKALAGFPDHDANYPVDYTNECIQASVYLSLSLLSGSLKSSVSLYRGSAPSSKSL